MLIKTTLITVLEEESHELFIPFSQNLNDTKHLEHEAIFHILENVSTYLDCLPLESSVPGPWGSFLQLLDSFLRKLHESLQPPSPVQLDSVLKIILSAMRLPVIRDAKVHDWWSLTKSPMAVKFLIFRGKVWKKRCLDDLIHTLVTIRNFRRFFGCVDSDSDSTVANYLNLCFGKLNNIITFLRNIIEIWIKSC